MADLGSTSVSNARGGWKDPWFLNVVLWSPMTICASSLNTVQSMPQSGLSR
jgi:hypothetical protein